MNTNNNHENNLVFYFFSALITSASSLLISTYLTTKLSLLRFNTSANLDKYILGSEYFQPESNEYVRVVLFFLLFLVFFYVSYHLMKRFFQQSTPILKKPLYSTLFFITVLLLIVLCTYILFFKVYGSVNGLYTHNMILFTEYYWLLIPAFLVCVLIYQFGHRIPKILINTLSYVSLIIIIVFILIQITQPPSNHHGSAVYSSIYNVYYGATLYYDTSSLYGAYAYFFVPILKVIGLSIKNFVFIIEFLIVIISVLIYLIQLKLLKNAFYAFVAAVSILYILIIHPFTPYPVDGLYMQMMPIRVLFPAIILFLLTQDASKANAVDRDISWIPYLVSSFALLFNFESGIACLVVIFLYHFFSNTARYGFKSVYLWRKSAIHFLMVISSILIFILILETVTFLRCNQFISIVNVIIGVNTFAHDGFFMLPMPKSLHLYLLVIMTLMFGIGLALRDFNFSSCFNINKENRVVLVISLMAAMFMLYYAGRSHDQTLFIVLWYPSMLIPFFTLKIADKIKDKTFTSQFRIIISPIMIVLLSLMLTFCGSIFTRRGSNTSKVLDKNIAFLKNPYQLKYINQIADFTTNNLAFISETSAYYMTELNKKNDYLGCFTGDYFLKSDISILEDFILSHQGDLILGEKISLLLVKNDALFPNYLSDNFELVDTINLINEDIYLFKRIY